MVSKTTEFFDSYMVDYEGIDLGMNSDKLPASLVKTIEGWLAQWDPRKLRPTCFFISTPALCVPWHIVRAHEEVVRRLQEAAEKERLNGLAPWLLTPFSFDAYWLRSPL